ncbi:hypothetical protein M747DRAFT_310935 [Aspergillus niger ATCC 13496]|uniref:Uncharacterized protein n=1 Tax=Aspergillus niger ATCC 13496 TaxID=1353008 RepID=A0A370BM72_ASPNG|nr:hypothetical protein M747DRAFT_310935 [Aspergillus niger ATCC 13496]
MLTASVSGIGCRTEITSLKKLDNYFDRRRMTANAEKGITTDTLSRSTRSIPEIDIVHMMVGADFLRQTGQWNCAGSAGQVGTTKTVGELQHDREPLAGFGKASEI